MRDYLEEAALCARDVCNGCGQRAGIEPAGAYEQIPTQSASESGEVFYHRGANPYLELAPMRCAASRIYVRHAYYGRLEAVFAYLPRLGR